MTGWSVRRVGTSDRYVILVDFHFSFFSWRGTRAGSGRTKTYRCRPTWRMNVARCVAPAGGRARWSWGGDGTEGRRDGGTEGGGGTEPNFFFPSFLFSAGGCRDRFPPLSAAGTGGQYGHTGVSKLSLPRSEEFGTRVPSYVEGILISKLILIKKIQGGGCEVKP